ncbi:MAG: 2-hydroxyacid dehydrogenase [Candidatus Bathyarchaeia archaeon]
MQKALEEALSDRKDLEFYTLEWKFFREETVAYRREETRLGVWESVGRPEELIKEMKGVHILVVHGAPVTAKVIEASSELQLIGCTRGGPVNVDVEAATRRRIPVLYTPGRNADAVADFTLGLIIAELRNIARAHASLKQGVWNLDYNRHENLGPELGGLTLGIVGLGSIGSKVAVRARAFGMRIIAYDPYVSPERFKEAQAERVCLSTLLRSADIVTLHCVLNEETRGLIGAKELALMKPSAYLVNTARGGLVDYKALTEALNERRIAGAALDVYEMEPLSPEDQLLKLENVTLTSHIAGYSRDVVERCSRMIAEDVKRYLAGERPLRVLNPVVFTS